MAEQSFRGFAGVALSGELLGDAHAPPVLLLHGGGQTRAHWVGVATALREAGRQTLNLDLRGHGASEWPADGRYDFDAFVADLRAVLAQLPARPVIVGSSLGGWIATVALGEDGAHLAAGLVLVDAPPQMDEALSRSLAEAMRRRAQRTTTPLWDIRTLGAFEPSEVVPRLHAAATKLTVPVMFIRGAQSRLTDHDSVEAFVKGIPNAEFAEIDEVGAAHLIVTERAETFNAVLLDFLERRAPLAPPVYRASSDARALRDALGCFATGVTVVTATAPDGTPIGLTANSFTSVSLDPPLLLVCIALGARSAAAIQAADHFAVNVLQIGQQPASNIFAGQGQDRFASTAWEKGETGAPMLTGSLGAFECARHAVHDGGDHIILVGRVVRAVFDARRDPLLYFRGKYRRLHFA
jgi:flavin reductase (DIM6/NTAB) family NADH-FMN oxidoreductase RutF/pimeloyl-ACP methyl ester carboxylesterase